MRMTTAANGAYWQRRNFISRFSIHSDRGSLSFGTALAISFSQNEKVKSLTPFH
jgi:hypothetical protein